MSNRDVLEDRLVTISAIAGLDAEPDTAATLGIGIWLGICGERHDHEVASGFLLALAENEWLPAEVGDDGDSAARVLRYLATGKFPWEPDEE